MNHLYYRFIYLASETSFYVIKFFHFKSPNWLINVALIDCSRQGEIFIMLKSRSWINKTIFLLPILLIFFRASV
jgi:hypothetical protein